LEGDYVKADQRQHPRYCIRDEEFHVFNHSNQTTGKLVNISQGGLAFQCTPEPGKKTECRAIDILGPEPDRFYVSEIACRSIYNIGVLAEGRTFTGADSRLCGLQFIALADEQTQKLTDLIDRHADK
jgi:hypothetical protein